ncbi:MAG TPA: serine/threonine-protein kinase [Ktedonobacteraceae bacterium]
MEILPLRNDWQGKLIARYQLEKLLGRGGASEVWLATDTQLRRQVAIKILPAATNDQVYLRDFIYEARAAASLEHPHILGIHDFGEQEIEPGEVMPYLVIPYVAGGTLATRMKEASGPLPLQECLRYLRQAAQAIDYAHSKRILHRDIKPANMLLRDDWLLLTDFGLAKVLGATMMRSQTSAGSGTPEYMAPEQIMGQAQPASDRYSLAVVAYQLFTGSTPFRGATPAETIRQQMQAPLPSPRSLNPQIPVTVENLLLIALSRNPHLRPPSCLALVDALQKSWMSGTPTASSPDATLLAPWSKRLQDQSSSPSNPPVNGDLSSSPAWSPQAGITNVLPPMAHNASTVTDRNPTSSPPAPADPFATNVSAITPGISMTLTNPPYQPGLLERKIGRRSILIGGVVAAVLVIGGGAGVLEYVRTHTSLASQALKPTPTPLPGPHNLMPGEPVLQLTAHTAAVWTASWHPDGRHLLTASADGFIMLWDIASALQSGIPGSTLATPSQKVGVGGIKFQYITDAVCWSKDGKKIIVGNTFNDKAYVLDASNLSTTPVIYRDLDLSVLGDAAIYTNVAAGPSNDTFTVTNGMISGSQVQLWRYGQTNVPLVNYDVQEELDTLHWSPDGSMLAATTGSLAKQNGFYVWDKANPWKPRFFISPSRNKALLFAIIASTLVWSPVNPHLLLVSNADQALIWDVRQDQPLYVLSATVDNTIPEISRLSWSPGGRYIAASYDPTGDNTTMPLHPQIFIWDMQTILKQAPSSVRQKPSLTFSAPPGSPGHAQGIIDLSWSPDGRYLATSSFDKTVIIWKVDKQ